MIWCRIIVKSTQSRWAWGPPCVPSISRRAIFKLSPNILLIPHQNLMPLLFRETKAQKKIKHIEGSLLSSFSELLVTSTEESLRCKTWTIILHFQFSRTGFEFTLLRGISNSRKKKKLLLFSVPPNTKGNIHLLGRETLDNSVSF